MEADKILNNLSIGLMLFAMLSGSFILGLEMAYNRSVIGITILTIALIISIIGFFVAINSNDKED